MSPEIARATGYRKGAEGGEGGGATWENELVVVLEQDRIRLVETQTVNTPYVRESEVPLEGIGDVRIGGDFLKIRLKRRRWWDHVLQVLDDPPRVRFHREHAEEFRDLAARLTERVR